MVLVSPEIKSRILPKINSKKDYRVDMICFKKNKVIKIEVVNVIKHGRRKTF